MATDLLADSFTHRCMFWWVFIVVIVVVFTPVISMHRQLTKIIECILIFLKLIDNECYTFICTFHMDAQCMLDVISMVFLLEQHNGFSDLRMVLHCSCCTDMSIPILDSMSYCRETHPICIV